MVFKQQSDGLPVERAGIIARRVLDLGGEIEQMKQLIVVKSRSRSRSDAFVS